MSTTEPKAIYITHCLEVDYGKYRPCTVEITSWETVDKIVAEATKVFGPRVSSLPPQTKAEAMERGTNLRGYKDSRGNTVLYGPSQDQVGAENPPVGNTVGDQDNPVTSTDDSAPHPHTVTSTDDSAPQPDVLSVIKTPMKLMGVSYDKTVVDLDTKGAPYEAYRLLLEAQGMDLGGNIYSEVCLYDPNVITFTQYKRIT